MKILRRRKLLRALDTIKKKTVLVRSTSKINYIVLGKYFNEHNKNIYIV